MAGTTINPYCFGGQLGYRRDGPNRLYIRQRHLDTTRGQWLSRDPILTAPQSTDIVATNDNCLNFYWYAKNRPTTLFDPSGLEVPEPPYPNPPEGSNNPIANALACTACAISIRNNYEKTVYHHCNHMYAHCLACCILARWIPDGGTCAQNFQYIQNQLAHPTEAAWKCRHAACSAGVSGASSSLSCYSYCSNLFPFYPPKGWKPIHGCAPPDCFKYKYVPQPPIKLPCCGNNT